MRQSFHKSTTVFAEMEAFDEDRKWASNLINGSALLRKAIETGCGPSTFIWSAHDTPGTWQARTRSQNSGFMDHRVNLIHEREARADRLRVDRDSCTYCGTRRDIGCGHL